MTDKTVASPRPQWGYSFEHDAALNLCRSRREPCPFGCVKDGAPNCWYHFTQAECEPAQIVLGTMEGTHER